MDAGLALDPDVFGFVFQIFLYYESVHFGHMRMRQILLNIHPFAFDDFPVAFRNFRRKRFERERYVQIGTVVRAFVRMSDREQRMKFGLDAGLLLNFPDGCVD